MARQSGTWHEILDGIGFRPVRADPVEPGIRAWQSLRDWFPVLHLHPRRLDRSHKSVIIDLKLSAYWSNPSGFRFSIGEESRAARLARRLGVASKLSVDEAHFDARFRVETNRPHELWDVIREAGVKQLLGHPPHIHFTSQRASRGPILHELILSARGSVAKSDWDRPPAAMARWVRGLWGVFAETLSTLPVVLAQSRNPIELDVSRLRDTAAGRVVEDGLLRWNGDRVRRDAATALFNGRDARSQDALMELAVGDRDIYVHTMGAFAQARLLRHQPDRAIPLLLQAMSYRSWRELRVEAIQLLDELGAGAEARALERVFSGDPYDLEAIRDSRYWWACAESLALFIQWALEHDGRLDSDGPAVSWHAAIRASALLADLAATEALPWVEALDRKIRVYDRLDLDTLETALHRLRETARLPRSAPQRGSVQALPRPASAAQARTDELPRPPE